MYVIEFVGYYFLFFLFFVFCICILHFVFRISIIFPLRPCLRRLNPGAAGAHLSSPPLARLQSFLPEETTILIFYLFPVFLKLSPGFLLQRIACRKFLHLFIFAGNCSSSRLYSLIVSIKFVFKWKINFFLRSVILLSRIFFLGGNHKYFAQIVLKTAYIKVLELQDNLSRILYVRKQIWEPDFVFKPS